jgi:Mn2+/Fe2+ NRAMP family transporter
VKRQRHHQQQQQQRVQRQRQVVVRKVLKGLQRHLLLPCKTWLPLLTPLLVLVLVLVLLVLLLLLVLLTRLTRRQSTLQRLHGQRWLRQLGGLILMCQLTTQMMQMYR